MSLEIDFPDLVSALRVMRGLSQERLARELDVSYGTVNGWENGRHRPIPAHARLLLDMAATFGVKIPDSQTKPGESWRDNSGERNV